VAYASLPAIDYQRLHTAQTRQALDTACRDWGLFILLNHPLAHEENARLLRVMAAFFRAPQAFKRSVSRTADNPCGFYDAELTSNIRDLKEIFDYSPAESDDDTFPWPPAMDAFRHTVKQHYAQCEELAMELLAAIGQNLGTPAQQLAQHFTAQHTSFLRLNFYPLEAPGKAHAGPLGINPHTDAGALTVLVQDEHTGLEVHKDGAWHRVPAGALVVNLGDIVQVWSNDRYTAPLHRVIASEGAERFSAPFFLNPRFDTVYEPLPGMVDPQHPPLYHPISWSEFRSLRAAGDYADYGEEVQIHQYRIRC